MNCWALGKMAEGGFGVDPEKWFALSTEKIELLKLGEDQLYQQLFERVEQMRGESQSNLWWGAMAVLICLLLTGLISWKVVRDLHLGFMALHRTFSRLVNDNDLTVRVNWQSGDELGALAKDLNRFLQHLEGLLLEVRRSCDVLTRSASNSNGVIAEVNEGVVRGVGPGGAGGHSRHRDGLDRGRNCPQCDPDIDCYPAGYRASQTRG